MQCVIMIRQICGKMIRLLWPVRCLPQFFIKRQIRVNLKQLVLGILYGFALGWAMVHYLDFRDKKLWYQKEKFTLPILTGDFDQYKNTSMAKEMVNDVKILCWMRIYRPDYDRIDRILFTWAKRCNKIMFFSDETYPNLPLIRLNFEGNVPFFNAKVVLTYLIRNKILNPYDWILNVSPDMFVVMENLRYVLQEYDPNKKYHFSATFRENQAPAYLTHKAGYVLSKAAAESFYKIAVMREIDKTHEFPFIPWTVFVRQFVTVDTDLLACSRQHKLLPENFEIAEVNGGKFMCIENFFFSGQEFLEACTNNFITFHKCRPHQILELEYLIYGLKPYGIAVNYSRNNETSIREGKY